MKQEQILMKVDIFSLNKNQLKETLKGLKEIDAVYKVGLFQTFIELFQDSNNQDDSSKLQNNIKDFLENLFKLMKLNSRISDVEKIIRLSEKKDNKLGGLNEEQKENVQEMFGIKEENNNSNGDNNINSKKY